MPPRAPNPIPLRGPAPGTNGLALSRWIIATCTRPESEGGLGFTAAGICAAEPPPPEDLAALNAFINGKQGQMSYIQEQINARINPTAYPYVSTVLVVADRYAPRDGGADAQAEADRADGTPRGRIARYARGRDYHSVIKRRLHRLADALRPVYPHNHFTSFTDTAPVLERRFAQRAGLGWLAKNAMLIHPTHGSYLLLGGFLTDLDLPTPPEGEQPVYTDHCGTCTRCIDACPTGAIARQPLDGGADPQPRVDGSRCISYLTIEHKGMLAAELSTKTGDWVFGCDICQEVCPHNSPRPGIEAPLRADYAPVRATLPLLQTASWGPTERSLLTVSSMKRATAAMFRRNAALALANLYRKSRDPALLEALERMRGDDEPLVKWTAVESLESLT